VWVFEDHRLFHLAPDPDHDPDHDHDHDHDHDRDHDRDPDHDPIFLAAMFIGSSV